MDLSIRPATVNYSVNTNPLPSFLAGPTPSELIGQIVNSPLYIPTLKNLGQQIRTKASSFFISSSLKNLNGKTVLLAEPFSRKGAKLKCDEFNKADSSPLKPIRGYFVEQDEAGNFSKLKPASLNNEELDRLSKQPNLGGSSPCISIINRTAKIRGAYF